MWVLIGILLTQEAIYAQPVSTHVTMADCFEAREVAMQDLPQPKINYEFVCVRTNLIEGV